MRKARPDGWIGPFDLSVFLVNSLTVLFTVWLEGEKQIAISANHVRIKPSVINKGARNQ